MPRTGHFTIKNIQKWRVTHDRKIWIQANMNENGIVDLSVETLLQAPEAFPPRWPEWIRTAERKPTAEDANEDGCVLSININPGDMNTTNWPWNMVAAFPDNLPVWMPLPKKPYLGKEK